MKNNPLHKISPIDGRYELIKDLTRGNKLNHEDYKNLIQKLPINEKQKKNYENFHLIPMSASTNHFDFFVHNILYMKLNYI